MISLDGLLWYYIVVAILFTITCALYGIATRPHIIKKLVLLTIISDAVYVLLVLMGYRIGATNPPVVPGGVLENPVFPSHKTIVEFMHRVVDPVPQVLIVTAIVIGLAQFVFLVTISMHLAKSTGSFDIRRIEGEKE